MKFPEDLLYTETHEWVRNEGNQVTIGLTDYAQSQLKDIVYVDMPEAGSEFKNRESIGVVESVRAVADVYSPVTGKVAEANFTLKDHPQFVNEEPYGKGWLDNTYTPENVGKIKRVFECNQRQEWMTVCPKGVIYWNNS